MSYMIFQNLAAHSLLESVFQNGRTDIETVETTQVKEGHIHESLFAGCTVKYPDFVDRGSHGVVK